MLIYNLFDVDPAPPTSNGLQMSSLFTTPSAHVAGLLSMMPSVSMSHAIAGALEPIVAIKLPVHLFTQSGNLCNLKIALHNPRIRRLRGGGICRLRKKSLCNLRICTPTLPALIYIGL